MTLTRLEGPDGIVQREFMEKLAELEQRVALGDTDAKYLLGAQLVSEPDSHEAVLRGVELLKEAAFDHHPEAVAELATMEAVASWRPGSWDRAFDYLERAAELGSLHARNQLCFLAGKSVCDRVGSANWAALRRSIDLEALLRSPQRALLSEQPRIHAIGGFASGAECRWIIDRGKRGLQRARVWDAEQQGRVDSTRTNRAAELRFTLIDVVVEVVRARISGATRLPLPIFETPQIMHYTVGQEFRPHYDFLDENNPAERMDMAWRGQRIMTFLLFLNDDFEGGQTDFPNIGANYRGRQGDAIFFANVTRDGLPDPLTLHAGCPPTSGEKWILSQWIRDRSPGEPPSDAK